MSGWVSPTHPPCTKSDPSWGAEGWTWGGEVGGENGRPPPHRVGGASWRRRSQGSQGRATDGRGAIWIQRELSCVILSSLTLVRNWKPPHRQ